MRKRSPLENASYLYVVDLRKGDPREATWQDVAKAWRAGFGRGRQGPLPTEKKRKAALSAIGKGAGDGE